MLSLKKMISSTRNWVQKNQISNTIKKFDNNVDHSTWRVIVKSGVWHSGRFLC